MKKLIQSLGVLSLAIFLSACNQGSKQGNVAVLDMAKVVTETGKMDEINNELQAIRMKVQNDLLEVQKKLQEQLKANKDKMGATPTEQQQKELAQMLARAQQRFKIAQNQASQTLKQKQAELISKLREQIKPIAFDAAKKRGMTIVMLKNDGVLLGYAPETDITNEVIAVLKKKTPAPAAKAPEKKADEKK